MKKLLLATAILIVGTSVFLSVKQEKKGSNFSEKEDGDKADATGMVNYLYNMMKDPATGMLDVKAYYKAVQQANMAIGSRSSNLGIQWNFIGPDNIGGRTRSILFDKSNPSKVFAAGVSGGLWISNDAGQSWVKWSGTDSLLNTCIVCMCQDSSGNIYFGTGEGLAGSLLSGYGNLGGPFVGYGIWKSTDDGVTFKHLASTTPTDTLNISGNWVEVNRIAANPHAPDSIIVAAQGSPSGIKVSADGGTTWTAAKGTLSGMGTDVKFSIDGKYVFASVNSNAGPRSSVATFYYSSNGGASFTKENGVNGFPKTDEYSNSIARIEFAVSPTNPNYAYAALINLANSSPSNFGSLAYVVRTTNGGASWDTIGSGTGFNGYYDLNGFNPTGPQGTYDLTIAVSPIDTNTIFLGGTTLWRWTKANSWAQISYYGSSDLGVSQHSDMHALVFDPTNSSRLLIGSDGGVSQTLNPYDNTANGVNYTSLNRNYNVTQFYSISADSEGRPFGGTQDNSNDYINFLGNTVQSASQVLGGDGAETEISTLNDNAFYAGVPGSAELYRSSTKGTSWEPTFSDGVIRAQANTVGAQFILPFDLWNADSISLMAAGLGTTGTGEVWVSPDDLNFSTSPLYYQLQNTSGDPTAMKFSPDGKYLYVGTDNGSIYRYSGFDSVRAKNRFKYGFRDSSGVLVRLRVWNAQDSGIVVIQSPYAGFSGRTIASISVDPSNYNRIVVTAVNYGDTYNTWVALSNNAQIGFDFISIQSDLPYGPVYSSCILREAGSILLGTQHGIWSSQNSGASWQYESGGLANVPVFGVKESPYFGSYAIYAGTYGLGMFASNTYTTGINDVKTDNTVNNLTVFPNPLSGTGHIEYTLSKSGNVIINLYDITGKLVKRIADENISAGTINISFNTADLVSGTYIVDVIDGQSSMTKKIAVLR